MEDGSKDERKARAHKIAATLVSELRSKVGDTEATEILKLLRELDVLKMGAIAEYPVPMAFDDAWREAFDVLLEEDAAIGASRDI